MWIGDRLRETNLCASDRRSGPAKNVRDGVLKFLFLSKQ